MLTRLICALGLSAIVAVPAFAQDDTWTWRKVIPAGRAIEIRGVIGDISATPASGNEVEVVARKHARRSDPGSVRIEVVEHAGGVTICAMYEARNECLAGGHGNTNSRDNDTNVDFEVRVPSGVLLTAKNVIGDVEATGLTADVYASSVTGNVRVSTAGLVEASSVSGNVRARVGRTDWTQTLSFSSVSGDIVIEFAGDLNTDVSMSTVSGELESDWPIATRSGRSRGVRGTIGGGGRKLSLSTVSGDVELRKAN